MKLLEDWIIRLQSKEFLYENRLVYDKEGNLVIKDQRPGMGILLGPFLYNTEYITGKDYDRIIKYWKSVEDLEGLARLFETSYKKPLNKVMPRIDFQQNTENLVYIGEIVEDRLEIKDILMPLHIVKDNIRMANIDRTYVRKSEKLSDLPIKFPSEGTRQYNSEYIYIKSESIVKENNVSRKQLGLQIGTCVIKEDRVLINLGKRWIYWDELNGTVHLDLKDVRQMIEVVTTFKVGESKSSTFGGLISNINLNIEKWDKDGD